MGKRILPGHIGGTIHQWRAKKRAEAKAVQRALRTMLKGCAFTPTRDIGVMLRMADENVERLSVKNWGH